MGARAFVKRLIGRNPEPAVRIRPQLDPPAAGAERLLEGRTALVTGAGRNVGRGIALELARHGAKVVLVDSDQARMERVRAESAEYGIDVDGYVCDVSRNDAIGMLLSDLARDSCNVDTLINNVGIGTESALLGSATPTDWENLYATNVIGPALLTKGITERMVRENRTGNVIFITSIHQWRIRKDPAYSSSKAALGMMVKELALELAPHGIRVNGIAPGWVEEQPDGSLLPNRKAPLHASSIPPNYIGRSVVMLVSEFYSRYTTGAVLKVDAGYTLS